MAPRGKHLFGIVKVGEKGQIVIPKEARDIFGIKPGDALVMLGDESEGMAIIKREKYMEFAEDILKAMEMTGDRAGIDRARGLKDGDKQ